MRTEATGGNPPCGGTLPRDCDWYFDLVSPFAYLQWKQRDRFADRLRLKPVPVVLGGLFKAWGITAPADVKPKRLQVYRLCQWRADRLGIPFRFPPVHPFNSVKALRLVVAAGSTPEAVDLLFDAAFRDGLDLDDLAVLNRLGRMIGLDQIETRIADPKIKQALRLNGEHAVRRGVFGVPTSAIGEELFWGEDSTAMMLQLLAEPSLFTHPDMARLADIPSSFKAAEH